MAPLYSFLLCPAPHKSPGAFGFCVQLTELMGSPVGSLVGSLYVGVGMSVWVRAFRAADGLLCIRLLEQRTVVSIESR